MAHFVEFAGTPMWNRAERINPTSHDLNMRFNLGIHRYVNIAPGIPLHPIEFGEDALTFMRYVVDKVVKLSDKKKSCWIDYGIFQAVAQTEHLYRIGIISSQEYSAYTSMLLLYAPKMDEVVVTLLSYETALSLDPDKNNPTINREYIEGMNYCTQQTMDNHKERFGNVRLVDMRDSLDGYRTAEFKNEFSEILLHELYRIYHLD